MCVISKVDIGKLIHSDRSAEFGAVHFRRALLRWFARNKRPHPWRDDPSPYTVWISEVMLQQTVVKSVIPYFAKWIKRFPTVESIARASEKEVLRIWEGLGYYNRALNLRKTARLLMRGCRKVLPTKYEQLLELPGIGEYTAAAICSIAYGQPYPVVDANVRRVLSRYRAIGIDDVKAQYSFLQAAISRRQPGNFNEAVMELGQSVCTVQSPKCHKCPLRKSCAFVLADLDQQPSRVRSGKRVRLTSLVLIVRCDDKLLLNPIHRGRFRGMFTLPRIERFPRDIDKATVRLLRSMGAMQIKIEAELEEQVHLYTKYIERLLPVVVSVKLRKAMPTNGLRWIPVERVNRYPLPSMHRRILNLGLKILNENPKVKRR